MLPIFIYVDCSYSDCVPLVCAYLKFSNYGPDIEEEEVSDCFETIGEQLATAMKSACGCGCPVRDLGVLVVLEMDDGKCKCRMQSLCAECLPKFAVNHKVVTLGQFEPTCFGLERSLCY